MNTRRCCFLLCLALLLLPLHAGRADVPPTPTPRPLSLADALAAMPDTSVAGGSVVLTVGPGQVAPVPSPSDAPPSENAVVQTPETLAEQYGRSLQVFSHVLALAPPTMTVLNTDPALAFLPLGRLAGQHPETYLLGSLTPAQLKQAGSTGLAYADMTPDQQSLMHALLPEPLEIVPTSVINHGSGPEEQAAFDAQTKKLSGDALFGALRFHAYLTANFYVHAPVGFGIGDTQDMTSSTGAYRLPAGGYTNMESRGKSTETLLKADVPNTPKPGDMEWNRRDLERTISLASLTTVDSLVQRLGAATHLELYADPHYASMPVLARGDLKERQPVRDVMQALALCVCGTWRQVGPAYVLTDDVQGLGTRQAFLAEVGQIWGNRLSEAGKDAGKQLGALDWIHTLSFAPGDIGTLPPDQITTIQKASGTNEGNLPWKTLPLALQDHLKDHFLHYNDMFPKQMPLPPQIEKMGDDMKAAAESVRPDTPVDTTVNIRLAVELPGTGAMMLFGAYKVQPPKPDEDPPAAKPDTSAPVNSIVLDKPLRGVLCAPKTADEARAVVTKMVKMRLNTLFLDVFTGGRTYFPNDALPPASADAGGVLAAALAAAKPQHIAVYAVMDTLCWRKDGLVTHPASWPGGYMEDLTITGETASHVVQRRYAANALFATYDHPRYALSREGTEGWASPLDPAVRALLPALSRTLAATPGLAGLVFEDTILPGYHEDRPQDGNALGYSLLNRLAYLRTKHLDPVDISSSYGDMVSVFVSEENFFGHYDITVPTFSSQSDNFAAWMKLLKNADTSLLAGCWQSAHAAAPSLPLLLRGELPAVSVINPWNNPLHTEPSLVTPENYDALHRFTAQSILTMPYGPDEQAHLDRFVESAQTSSKDGWGKGAGGEVFDLITGGPPEHLVDTLDKLDALLKK